MPLMGVWSSAAHLMCVPLSMVFDSTPMSCHVACFLLVQNVEQSVNRKYTRLLPKYLFTLSQPPQMPHLDGM
jgi:hypothetical protein